MTGYGAEEKRFVEIAREMGFDEARAKRAHGLAVERQLEFFAALKAEGRRILAELEADPDRIAVVLFGRPYNAFTDEANKGVPFKFASRGIEIIPFDFLALEEEENFRDTYWEMGQKIIKAARIVKRHPQLFGCYLTNFLCALDSMMVPHFRDLMQTKPSLTLEVDSHTADAGVNTRIEAFLDVVRNYVKIRDAVRDPVAAVAAARTEIDHAGRAFYVDSGGERFPVRDPRVKVVVPSMGDLFAEGMAAVFRGMGWNAEALPVCDREALDLGRAVTTNKECLPIINILGEIRRYLKHRSDPSEKLLVIMVDAGGCCRVGQYEILIRAMIEKQGLRDVAMLLLSNDDGYAGLGVPFRLEAVKALYLFDVLDDVRSAIKALAVDRQRAMAIFETETRKLLGTFDGTVRRSTYGQLREAVKALSAIRLRAPLREARYIGVVGEIFVRRDHFCLMGIPERLAQHGFVMLDAPVSEWVRYTDFMRGMGLYTAKLKLAGRLEALVSGLVQLYHERRVKRLLARSGLYERELIDIRAYLAHSTHFIPLQLTGEPGLSSGAALHHLAGKYCGIIAVGPFGCMNARMTEAVAAVEMTVEGKERAARNAGRKIELGQIRKDVDVLPCLFVELDGNVFTQIEEARLETFLLQAQRLADAVKAAGNRQRQGERQRKRTDASCSMGGRVGSGPPPGRSGVFLPKHAGFHPPLHQSRPGDTDGPSPGPRARAGLDHPRAEDALRDLQGRRVVIVVGDGQHLQDRVLHRGGRHQRPVGSRREVK